MDAQPKSPALVNVDLQERNARLLAQLLEDCGPRLRRHAIHHAPNDADGEDALQNASILFLSRYTGPEERDRTLSWMYLVTKRCAWAIGRELRLQDWDFDELSDSGDTTLSSQCRGPEECLEAKVEASERIEFLGRLKRDERRALMAFGAGYSYEEICERFNWTYTKVNRCIAEGRAALRAIERGER